MGEPRKLFYRIKAALFQGKVRQELAKELAEVRRIAASKNSWNKKTEAVFDEFLRQLSALAYVQIHSLNSDTSRFQRDPYYAALRNQLKGFKKAVEVLDADIGVLAQRCAEKVLLFDKDKI